MLKEYDDILTTEETCEVLKIGYNSLYSLLNNGQLKGYKCGRVWRIPKIAVEAFILDSANLSAS